MSYKISGTIRMSGDKSIAHRALIMASHIKGKHTIENFPNNDDVITTLSIFKEYGLKFKTENNILFLDSKNMVFTHKTINCNDSGTSARLLCGYLSGLNIATKIIGTSDLSKRPMARIVKPLNSFGVNIESVNDKLPVSIYQSLQLKNFNFKLKIASAQLKSALILYALSIKGENIIRGSIKTRDHLELLLSYLGYPIIIKNDSIIIQGGYKVEKKMHINLAGDISSASFIIAASILLEDSVITIKDVCLNPYRLGFVKALIKMGANICFNNERLSYGELIGDIKVGYSPNLKGININESEFVDMIDEVPIFCVIASHAKGRSTIKGVSELMFKESNRIKAIIENIDSMGGDIRFNNNCLIINPKKRLYNTIIKSYGDHRIFMAFYIANLVCGRLIKENNIDLCYNKSFPEFIDVMKRIIQ